jgi:hypothetical protein
LHPMPVFPRSEEFPRRGENAAIQRIVEILDP